MTTAKMNWKFRGTHQGRFFRNNEQIRALRNLMGELIDTDTNTIYKVDGQKQEDIAMNLDTMTTTTTTTTAPKLQHKFPDLKETACIAACHSCVEEDSFESNKKKAADNCGPMCDCADSCLLYSAEKVGQAYGQSSNHPHNTNCWWRTFNEILGGGFPTFT